MQCHMALSPPVATIRYTNKAKIMHLAEQKKQGKLSAEVLKLIEQVEKGPNKMANKRLLTNNLVQGNPEDGYQIDLKDPTVQDMMSSVWKPAYD